MAIDNPVFLPGMKANGAMATQYSAVMHTATANTVAVCTGATDVPCGIQYSIPTAAGQGVDVAALTPGHPVKGIVASAGVSPGNVGVTATGLIENKSTDTDFIMGRVDQSWDSEDICIIYPAPGYLAG
jgi:hypothetical protein